MIVIMIMMFVDTRKPCLSLIVISRSPKEKRVPRWVFLITVSNPSSREAAWSTNRRPYACCFHICLSLFGFVWRCRKSACASVQTLSTQMKREKSKRK